MIGVPREGFVLLVPLLNGPCWAISAAGPHHKIVRFLGF